MAVKLRDITPKIDLARERGAGPVRRRYPVYVDLLPPCNDACPAGENVQAWLDRAQAGAYREAWEILVRDNPLPGVHGRVCYHPCENACNRGSVDSPVSIHSVERFLGDLAVKENWPLKIDAPETGKRVLVVGAGPCGLSAAYHLRRRGHAVEVRDAGPLPGGMMHFGIPAYRMPRAELRKEIAKIEAMGAKLVTNHKVCDLLLEQRQGGFDAVLVAIGAGLGKRLDIPSRDAARVLDAVRVLRRASSGKPPLLGRRVIVYGGGNTAMDTARTARRLGAAETLIVYRRDREHMPAHDFEADEAIEEGIKIRWLTTIKAISGSELTVERMLLDDKGRPQPTGQFEILEADSLVLALGQETDCEFLRQIPEVQFTPDGAVIVGPDMMTGRAGIFAGGDMVPGEQSVTHSIGHGKRAAASMDAWLRGTTHTKAEKHPVVKAEQLRLPVYSDAEPTPTRLLPVPQRLSGFDEVVGGLNEVEARFEAQRCYSCGNCFECDNCYAACPEDAIIKLGPGSRYRFDYENCTGCAVCFEQCPCHAIEMLPEAVDRG